MNLDTSQVVEGLDGSEIAIVGMAGRFPGAPDLAAFWHNLQHGVESIAMLSETELLAAGVDPAELRDPSYVRAAPLLDDVEHFDAQFFGYTPREAELMDPQQRLLLECAWTALEHAGYNPETYPGAIGVFAGAKTNTYLFTLAAHPELRRSLDFLQIVLGGDLALLSTRISYKLDLKGPSYAVQTACSTSLVAVHLACQSLLIDECRMALAGAVAINVPHVTGYYYQEGGIASPDGHCRPFDADAAGTIFGSGVGMVVLKRLQDALDDGDTIHAVIRGSATNNDGSDKASFTAPSVEGQTKVIIDALAVAGIDAQTISYVEAHGTGTALGDPIEVLALSEAYQASTDQTQFCALGSVKSNVGHLDAAAGMSSLLKTVLALQHRQIPPSLHYKTPNPRIDFANSPFYVNQTLRAWDTEHLPRRAGVSSFGFGGTNAHIILEEAPLLESAAMQRSSDHGPQVLVLSARTAAALEHATSNLADVLARQPEVNLADVAYTLQLGRKAFAHRRILICRDRDEALSTLQPLDVERVLSAKIEQDARPVAFLFPGQGAQYVGMGRDLYASEPVFRAVLDRCCTLLQPALSLDLRAVLYPAPDDAETASAQLTQTALAQPALFVVSYALAQLWQHWGVTPSALLGHSVGEVVAATLAGVFTLDDALALVATRGRLMQTMPAGAMLAVALSEAALRALLGPDLALAAVNGPAQCVVSGPSAAVAALADVLTARGVQHRPLHTSHAFHSPMMEPVVAALGSALQHVPLRPPTLPFVSNVSGTWITAAQATDPAYWTQQLRQPVLFNDSLRTLLESADYVLLEVGPGTTLSSFVRQQPAAPIALASLRHPHDQRPDLAFLLTALGRLWLAGVAVDWSRQHQGARRQRIPLPTYPFERQRYWIDVAPMPGVPALTVAKQPDLADWFYLPHWEPTPLTDTPQLEGDAQQRWLILAGQGGLGEQIAQRLRQRGDTAIAVNAGSKLQQLDEHSYTIAPQSAADYETLFAELVRQDQWPDQIVHLWNVTSDDTDDELIQMLGFNSLLLLTQTIGKLEQSRSLRLIVVANQLYAVERTDEVQPAKATLIGPCLVIPKEFPQISTRLVDLPLSSAPDEALLDALLVECLAQTAGRVVAYRDGQRWIQQFVATRLEQPVERPALLRERGVYLITGGLGGVGLVLAEYLARTVQARLVLTGRTELPSRATWDEWQAAHAADDPTTHKLRQLKALEAHGAEVLVLSADVTDEAQMRAVVSQAQVRFGAIHGVIHAAGIAGGGVIQFKTPEQAARVLAPKVRGAQVLDALFAEHPLDMLVLCSSLQAILGDFGQIDYAAANAFFDALAQRDRDRSDRRTIAINWDNWREVGIAVNTQVPTHLQAWHDELLEKAIDSAEAVAVFERVLAASQPQIAVSTQELAARLTLSQSFNSTTMLSTTSGYTPAAPLALRDHAALSRSELEPHLSAIWQRVLGLTTVGLHDNFFDLGGDSLSAMQLQAEIKRELGVQVSPVALFESPTISALARQLSPEPRDAAQAGSKRQLPLGVELPSTAIAIIGMAGRFPGAPDLATFWRNLQDGVESIRFFDDDELRAAGIPPALLADPHYVKARPILDDVAAFDAALFGYTPREAELMDPQHRVLMEIAWSALEDAGYAADTARGAVGVYAGSSMSTYLLNLYADPALTATVDPTQAVIGNDKDALTTSISYKLNLKGPSLAVQTFCSTSLVAVHLACQSLLHGECDLALAGGVSIFVPQQTGYHYQSESIVSPDGHCRPFDADAQGTLFGNGAGLVVLKRLDDALTDGDTIQAVVRGTAINNDGSLKVGYTAPSVEGQAAVISAALAAAQVDPATVGYVEAHGTGTALGDPIEVTALSRAYHTGSDQTNHCALGSVKGNIGHLDRAAGVAALIKTVLALKHAQLPPSINFTRPNPKIDFASSPFYVNTELHDWPISETPRRAGVSSLGFGGTNAHIILEEAPSSVVRSDPAQPWQTLVLSARTPTALQAMTEQLHDYLAQHPDVNLADVAYTLQTGRKALPQRRVLIARDVADAVSTLGAQDPQRLLSSVQDTSRRPIIFLCSGQGAQYVGMGRDLYATESVFRDVIDRCARLLEVHLGLDLRAVLYPAADDAETASAQLTQTALAQPALFVIEYALAELWQSWGVTPTALLGHSIGEYVAATLAGVFTLPDALGLVATRGRLMQAMPPGAMLAVPLAEHAIMPLLGAELHLAAVNGPQQCVVSGPDAAIEALTQMLATRGVQNQRLHTSHAFHSAMFDPIVGAMETEVARLTLQPPTIPFVSNVTGTWITAAQATDPAYWGQHLRQPVRFAAGLEAVTQNPQSILIEIGPGRTLSALARQQIQPKIDHAALLVVQSLRHAQEQHHDRAMLLGAVGQLWLAGLPLDWTGGNAAQRRQRMQLPTYPFDHQRYWLTPQTRPLVTLPQADGLKRADLSDWFYLPSWQLAPLLPTEQPQSVVEPDANRWLIFVDPGGIGAGLAERLIASGQAVHTVTLGPAYAALGDGHFTLDPQQTAGYDSLLRELLAAGQHPTRIVHLWSVTTSASSDNDESFAATQAQGFYSVLTLVQTLSAHAPLAPVQLAVIGNQMQSVTDQESLQPAKATLLGLCKVIPQEYPNIVCASLDILVPRAGSRQANHLLDQLVVELQRELSDDIVAYRGTQRWTQRFEQLPLAERTSDLLRPQGVYLITGGLVEIGLALSETLAQHVQARLVLVEEPGFPAPDQWQQWLTTHPQQDSISARINQAQRLTELGATVEVVGVALSDVAGLRAVVEQTITRHGTLHGVIHAAGVVGERAFKGIQDLDRATCEAHFAAKGYGLFALEQALEGVELDFCLLNSSISCFLGGRGYAAYAAGNACVDAFTQSHNRRADQPWISVNWDAWQLDKITTISANLAQLAMSTQEGGAALRRIIATRAATQIVVSTGDLSTRIAQGQQSLATMRAGAQALEGALDRPRYPRPALPTPFVEPSSELERTIAAVWQQALGFEEIGLHDNFFELGGDSLIALQVVARLKDALNADISVVSLYEQLTIAGLAKMVTQEQSSVDQFEQRETRTSRRNQLRQAKQSSKRSRRQEFFANIDEDEQD